MRSLAAILLIVCTALSLERLATASDHALGSEEVEIYKGFLQEMKGSDQTFLVDGFDTSPLAQINGEAGPYVQGGCLVGIDFGSAPDAKVSYVMPHSIAEGTDVSIVRVKQVKRMQRKLRVHHSSAEIISLSTIRFDRTHQFAVFQWSHSGSWQLIVFELTSGRWVRSQRRNCPTAVE